MISIHSTLGWSKIFMYENSILHKAAIVPFQESDFVAKFESNSTIFRGCYNVPDFVATSENKRQSFFLVSITLA